MPAAQRAARGLRQVDGGYGVQVGLDPAALHVEEHHADAIGLVDGLRLRHPTDPAALAHHDPSFGAGRVEGAGSADPGRGRRGACGRYLRAQHQLRGADPAGRRHRSLEPYAVRERDPADQLVAGGAPDRGHPRRRVGGVLGATAVAGGSHHDDVLLCGAEQRALDGVDGRRTADREVQDVDAIARGGVDRGDQVGGGAAVVGGVGRRPARLVDRDPGLGGDAAVRTEPLAGHLHRDPGVAGRDRRHLGAVAAVVERRERGGAAQGVLAEAVHEPAGTHQLAVAVIGVPAAALDAHATEAAWPATQPGDLGEQRALGPDAGVDEADHDTRSAAGGLRPPETSPGARHAGQRTDPVLLDQGDAGIAAQRLGLVGGELGGEAVEGRRPPVHRVGIHRREHLRLPLEEHGALDPGRQRAGVTGGAGPGEGHEVERAAGRHGVRRRGRPEHRRDERDGEGDTEPPHAETHPPHAPHPVKSCTNQSWSQAIGHVSKVSLGWEACSRRRPTHLSSSASTST